MWVNTYDVFISILFNMGIKILYDVIYKFNTGIFKK